MQTRIAFAVASLLVVGSAWMPAHAQGAGDVPDPGWVESPSPPPVASPPVPVLANPIRQMLDLYAAFCLRSFPEVAALDRTAATYGATPFGPNDTYDLGGQAGRGWTVKTSAAHYAIAVLPAPNASCSISRMTPSGFPSYAGLKDSASEFIAVRAYDSDRAAGVLSSGTGGPPRGTLVEVTPSQTTSPTGASVSATGYGLSNADGYVSDYFMTYITAYHGQPPTSEANDAVGGDGIEVQIVHTIAAAQ